MKLTTNIQYREGYLPTPRSRKVRYRSVNETVEVEIPEFSKSELRPAFIVHSRICDEWYRKDKTIYLCGDELYEEVSPDRLSGKPGNRTALECLMSYMENHIYDTDKTDKSKAVAKAEDYISDYMVADGILYRTANEPLYSIGTYGMGNNHGGTSLNVTTHDPWDYIARWVYSALDGELAVKEAKEVALGRGDTNYVQYIAADIEVLLPEAVKFPRRITDPYMAILEERLHGKPVEIFSTKHRRSKHRFNVLSAAPYDSEEGRAILLILDIGLRMKLPLLADGRCTRNWFINRSDSGVLQVEIDWDFLDHEYLDI